MEQSYEEAVTEVLDILNHTRMEDIKKISPKFIEYLKQHSSKTYIPNLDHTQKLKDMNLKPKTKALMCLIYRDYFCCDENQKKEYDKKIFEAELEYQKELQEKYNSDNLFKNKTLKEPNLMQTTTLMENKRQNVFQKILHIFLNYKKKNLL